MAVNKRALMAIGAALRWRRRGRNRRCARRIACIGDAACGLERWPAALSGCFMPPADDLERLLL
jgi:hypothetical protein